MERKEKEYGKWVKELIGYLKKLKVDNLDNILFIQSYFKIPIVY